MGNRNYGQELCNSSILTLSPVLLCASLPWGCSSSWAVPACVPPAGCCHQPAPKGLPCRVTSPDSKRCSLGSSLHEVTGAAGILFQKGLSMESLPPLDVHLLWCGPLQVLQGGSQLHHESSWVVRESSLWHLEHFLPRLFPGLYVCRALSPSCLAPLSQLLLCRFFSLLNYVIPEGLPPFLMYWALASSSSVLELVGIGFLGHSESFWHLFMEASLYSFTATICPCKAVHPETLDLLKGYCKSSSMCNFAQFLICNLLFFPVHWLNICMWMTAAGHWWTAFKHWALDLALKYILAWRSTDFTLLPQIYHLSCSQISRCIVC